MLYKQEGTIWEDKGDQQEGRGVGEIAERMHDVSMCCDVIVKTHHFVQWICKEEEKRKMSIALLRKI